MWGLTTWDAVQPSGKLAVSGESGKDSDVIVWDLATQKIIYRYVTKRDRGSSLALFGRKLLPRALHWTPVNDDGSFAQASGAITDR
jgi:hypothetical protein